MASFSVGRGELGGFMNTATTTNGNDNDNDNDDNNDNHDNSTTSHVQRHGLEDLDAGSGTPPAGSLMWFSNSSPRAVETGQNRQRSLDVQFPVATDGSTD